MIYMILFAIIVLFVICDFFLSYRFHSAIIYKGSGMSKVIEDGEGVIFRRLSPKKELKIGELYVFSFPECPEVTMGDLSQYQSCLCVKRLDRILPDGRLYFLGDNASHSCDSRYFGAVERERVLGKVIKIFSRDGNPKVYNMVNFERYKPGNYNEYTAYKNIVKQFKDDGKKPERK